MRFARELQSRCPDEFIDEVTPIQYGVKLWMRAGGRLIVWFRATGLVSKLSCEAAAPTLQILDQLDELLVGALIEPNRRTAIRETITDWRATAAARRNAGFGGRSVAGVGDGAEQDGSRSEDEPSVSIQSASGDPLAEIAPIGTIGVRRVNRSRAGGLPDGLGGPSGWSQSIGRRCEQFAFEWIAAQCGAVLSKGAGARGPVRFYIGATDRMLIWLNAATEQGRSWDIEERDAISGEILRRHEVKARTGELTDPEHALAIEHGDAYMIWRVDPDAGTCERLEAPARRPIGLTLHSLNDRSIESPIDRAVHRKPGEGADCPTMVVLGSSTRDFCRRLRRQHPGFVSRFRRNLVVVFRVTPELEAQLPPSKSRIWLANRSRAGCERLLDCLSGKRMIPSSTKESPLVVIGLQQTGRAGLRRAVEAATSGGQLRVWIRAGAANC